MSAHGTYAADGRQAGGALRARAAPSARRGVADGHRPGGARPLVPLRGRARRAAPRAPMRFVFDPDFAIDGEVLECDPPERFAFRWGKDVLDFTLDEHDGGTRLTMVHVLNEEGAPSAAKTAAGWHLCLDALAARLDGGSPRRAAMAAHARVERALRGVPGGRRAVGRRDPRRLNGRRASPRPAAGPRRRPRPSRSAPPPSRGR